MFCIQDIIENFDVFGCDWNVRGDNLYLQVCMCSLMEMFSYFFLVSEFDSWNVGEMFFVEWFIFFVFDNFLILFDRGYYLLGLLYLWMIKGVNMYWMFFVCKDLQYIVKY